MMSDAPKRKMKVTPEQKAAIIDWYRQKQALGTSKAKARELGMNQRTLDTVIERYRNPER
jgi:transposase-like protein